MRCVTYAGETVTTTDDVAEALVILTAAVASQRSAEAVGIPIVKDAAGTVGTAELVIGVGNDVLSAPTEWDGDEPDFSDAARTLREHRLYPKAAPLTLVEDEDPAVVADRTWDPDLDGYLNA
ncbi:MAG: hypothetical protein QM626_12485 [Microbacterium sp.]|uniref:hypothetical protein n=1 Tax=Microbacterium sp. TaxID=51671 RepID=UPI0039E67A2D